MPALDPGLDAHEGVEHLDELGRRRPAPERHVGAEVGDVRRQVDVRPPRHPADEGRIVALHVVGRQPALVAHFGHRQAALGAHREDGRLGRPADQPRDVDGVAEDHLGVEERPDSVGAEQVAVAGDGDGPQVDGVLRPQEVLLAGALSAQPPAVDDGPADVDAPRVVLGQGRDEAVVHRGQNREVGRAVRRLGGLVVHLDDVRVESVEVPPVAPQPLAEAERVGVRTRAPVQPRFEQRLGEADLGGDAETLVDGAPLFEKPAVALGVRSHEAAPRGVAHDPAAHQRLEQLGHPVAPAGGPRRQPDAVENVLERGVVPDPVSRPVAAGREVRQQAAVHAAAEDDAAVGNGEDVLPEPVRRAELGHRGEVRLVAGGQERPLGRLDGLRGLDQLGGRRQPPGRLGRRRLTLHGLGRLSGRSRLPLGRHRRRLGRGSLAPGRGSLTPGGPGWRRRLSPDGLRAQRRPVSPRRREERDDSHQRGETAQARVLHDCVQMLLHAAPRQDNTDRPMASPACTSECGAAAARRRRCSPRRRRPRTRPRCRPGRAGRPTERG